MPNESPSAQHAPKLRSLLQHAHASGTPKYVSLREALVELLKAGHWKPGQKFPTEEELLAWTSYSLGTVQKALRDLVEKRMLVRRQGVGSFVADLPRRLDHSLHCKFVDETGEDFLAIYSKALARRVVREEGPWTRYLGKPASGYLRLDRRIGIDNEFLIAGRFYCDPALLAYFLDCRLEELNGANFIALIGSRCNVPIRKLDSYVTVKPFPRDIRTELGMKRSQPGMLVQTTARAPGDRYVYYQEFYVPPVGRALYFSEEVAFVPERHRPLRK
jgi:GntR family transcriptional regulator